MHYHVSTFLHVFITFTKEHLSYSLVYLFTIYRLVSRLFRVSVAGNSTSGTHPSDEILDETIDQLADKLQNLFGNSYITSEEKNKALIPLERKNTEIRDSVDGADIVRHRKLRGNCDLIERIRQPTNNSSNWCGCVGVGLTVSVVLFLVLCIKPKK